MFSQFQAQMPTDSESGSTPRRPIRRCGTETELDPAAEPVERSVRGHRSVGGGSQ